MCINPIGLMGNWDEGYALDRHVISSVPIGEDAYGRMKFDTTRSDMGELLYYFKYKNKYDNLQEIIKLATPFVLNWNALQVVSTIMPAPASNHNRLYQPAYEIANAIAILLGAEYFDDVLIKRSTVNAKDLSIEQKHQISGTITKERQAARQHNMLLVDDLYQTGSTLNECVNVLRTDKNINSIYVLTMTKTKG